MRKISLMVMSVTVLFLFSCKENPKVNNEHNHRNEVNHHEDHSGHDHDGHHHDEESKGLTLNEGEKWLVSESLMSVAKEMAIEVDEFAKSGNKDYNMLAISLNEGINTLINKCELPDGAAHENLHEWLYPYMGLVKELRNTSTPSEGQAVFEKIQESFKTFNQYFE